MTRLDSGGQRSRSQQAVGGKGSLIDAGTSKSMLFFTNIIWFNIFLFWNLFITGIRETWRDIAYYRA